MSSGIWQRGKDEEGFYGFLIEDIQKERNRAARLVSIYLSCVLVTLSDLPKGILSLPEDHSNG